MALLSRAVVPLRAMPGVRQPSVALRSSFSMSSRRQAGGHSNESQFDPPTGWLFGVRPGVKRSQNEGWEWPTAVFVASLVFCGIALAFKPDTSVNTWALEEARRRLEAEGILPDSSPDTPLEKKD